MAGLSGLTAQTLGSSQTFNWTWFIELVTCGILVLWFTFYLNRLFATIVSYAIRTYFWHKFRIYLDIKSLQISLLGGRIFFKGVRYHGENETVYVHNGHLTWRYWLRTTKQIDLSIPSNSEQTEHVGSSKEKVIVSDSESEQDLFDRPRGTPESRLLLSISGLEWFIYNRTPVYDSIVKEAGTKTSSSTFVRGNSITRSMAETVQEQFREHLKTTKISNDAVSADTEKCKDDLADEPSKEHVGREQESPRSDRRSLQSDATHAETEVSAFYSIMLRFFPLGLECTRGAVSIGNENTKALIVTTFEKAKGHINATASGPADIFKQVFDFDIAHPVVQFKPNPDYHLPQMAVAEHIITGHEAVLKTHPWWRPNWTLVKHRRSLRSNLRNLLPYFRRSVVSLHNSPDLQDDTDGKQSFSAFTGARPENQQWHGLDRYMDEDDGDDHQTWMNIEYARLSTILDCPHIHLSFYWDTPGSVMQDHLVDAGSGQGVDLNGIPPPAYGMHLDVYGGLVNYGPWSDRLRVEIQNVFLPVGYKNAEPKQCLLADEVRLSTIMNITVNISRDITLRVPCRESSKDWRWRGRATAVRDAAALRKQQQRKHFRFRRAAKRRLGPDVRPFGWIAVAAGAGSKVRYTMDMFPGKDGFLNSLHVTLKNTKATSSVNHATLWECDEQDVSANLSNPLGWNQLHTWRFDIANKNMNLFLLRDHTALLIDLISDFTAGQKSDYMTFIPFHYVIGVKFSDLSLYLNSNDYNIVDNPCDLEENAFLVLSFASLVGQVDIPMNYFSPAQSSVLFKGHGREATLRLMTPNWHTLHNFGQDDTMAILKTLQLDGCYNYYSATHPSLTDSLFMNIVGGEPLFHLQGYLIRYFMNVKENYFGDDIHFSTIEEHQARLESLKQGEEEKTPPPKKQNDLDVILSVRADNSTALMPTGIYDRDENLRIDVLLIEADMRFTNYYMDLQVNSSPVEISTETSAVQQNGMRKRDVSSCQLFIESASIYGHRLFGAPPAEPTYLCNWDIDIGEVNGECTTQCIRILLSAVMAFMFTMDDDENALTKIEVAPIPDVTFLRMRAGDMRFWVVSADTAFLVAVDASSVELNDWANKHFSKYVKVNVPLLLVAAVDSASAYRYRDNPEKEIPTHACLSTSLRLVVVDRKSEFSRARGLQQEHIRYHDSRTHRAEWLLYKQHQPIADRRLNNWSRQPVPMPIPMMPTPLHRSVAGPHISTSSFLALHDPAVKHTQPRPNARSASSSVDSTGGSKASTISSPWIRPWFQLQNIQPDMSFLPKIDPMNLIDGETPADDFTEDEFPVTKEDLTHNGIFCDLNNGFTAFCNPNFAHSVVTLLNEISPNRPMAILDDLQIQTISNIKKLTNKTIGKVDDLSFRLPAAHIRIIDPHIAINSALAYDQYDVKLSRIRAIARIAPINHARILQTNSLLHVSLQEMKIEILECSPTVPHSSPSAEILVVDVSLWLSLTDQIRARSQIGNFELITAKQKIDSLAGLFQRGEETISRIVPQTQSINLASHTRHLLYHLTSTSDQVDPIFLSRPVNVLRATEMHVRVHDSWKTVIRLRHILTSRLMQQSLSSSCSKECYDNEQQAQQHILASFDQWSTWDTPGKDNDALAQAVFGAHKSGSTSTQHPVDLEVEVLLGRAAITLDPGTEQTQLLVQSLDLNYAEKVQQHQQGASWSFNSSHGSTRVLQLYAGNLGCHLNWGLVSLIEQIVELSKPLLDSQAKRQASIPSQPNDTWHRDYNLLVIVGADSTALGIQSPNIRMVTGLERFKASVNLAIDKIQKKNIVVTLSATAGRLRIHGLGKSTLGCKVTTPTIYLSIQDDPVLLKKRTIIHSAITGDKFRLHLKQDVVGLLNIAEAVLQNEVVSIRKLINIMPGSSQNSSSVSSDLVETSNTVEPHVALFLDNYLMQFDLMTYLRYKIAGSTARTSIIPHREMDFSIQVDLKENRHSFENPFTQASQQKSHLSMPPISVAVTVGLLPDRTCLDARIAVEKMNLNASAVRACFDAAYRPETISYIKNVQKSIDDIQQKTSLIFPKSAPQNKDRFTGNQRPDVQFQGYLVFEGIQLYCSAPAIRSDLNYFVTLNVQFDPMTVQISNIDHESNLLLRKPNFDIALRQITVDLERSNRQKENFGQLKTSFKISCKTSIEGNDEIQNFNLRSTGVNIDLHSETVILTVDLLTFLQARIKSLAAAEDAKKLKSLTRLTLSVPTPESPKAKVVSRADDEEDLGPLKSTIAMNVHAICLRWLVAAQYAGTPGGTVENMAFTVSSVDLRTKRDASARLTIRGLQLQLVPTRNSDSFERTANSALLPEMIFNAAYARARSTRKLAFKAAGKHLDVRLASNFIIPASAVQKSLARASSDIRTLSGDNTKADLSESSQAQLPKLLGGKRLAQLLVFADFGGAEVTISPAVEETQEISSAFGMLKGPKRSKAGRYGQAVQSSSGEAATLRSPGIAFQVEYTDTEDSDPNLSMEIRVAASSNTLAPSVVPLILEISSSVTNLMEQDNSPAPKTPATEDKDEAMAKSTETLQQATDPTAILGKVKLNAGLLVQKQEFSLTCQPVARVSATARFDEIFVVINTVQSKDQERFFSITTTVHKLAASVQHVYSRESTANFEIETIMVSLMNSKHISDQSGITAILNVSPMKAYLNAKQMQDFLLFREIWYPAELRSTRPSADSRTKEETTQGPVLQRFQEVTTTAVLPWHAIVSIAQLKAHIDFGQSIGKADFVIDKLWASSKKSSDSEQNLLIGFDTVGVESKGRMSGFVELQRLRIRTGIRWPVVESAVQAPLVQGAVGFEHLKGSAIFDYQPFAVVDVSSFDFLIYNVRQGRSNDRLVGILDGGKVQAFCITTAAAQGLSIYQAYERLVQEKQEAFEVSLHELDRFLRRKSVFPTIQPGGASENTTKASKKDQKVSHAPRLHVDVVITLRAIDAGLFMTSFYDETCLKLAAEDVQTRFAVGEADGKTHSGLGMSLGQVRLALSGLTRPNADALREVSVSEVIERATAGRGGTILKVPRLVASMQTWQNASSNAIEYVFHSTFQGKVDIGWNYSRISVIRNMWESHSRALAQKMSKPLAPSAIKITAEPKNEAQGQGKITAVVHMPQSKYEYIALQPPVIDTPQLRDLGEATPSLEWIGLNRERLPHVTHSVIIVSLLEVAKEIEDSYSRILGSGSR